ncbi:hypothetical protein GWI33_006087 [Rhynchophorus ferrugineus]|uniref:Uncharacterized protein n=1 Tax=Rhynchophorus ferrugineus TaxID=354439 RepID=A0A834MJ75_RHYFE|nr:hypothetical protein GWI33_006087 [Rhynchophorus ferrugineus]
MYQNPYFLQILLWSVLVKCVCSNLKPSIYIKKVLSICNKAVKMSRKTKSFKTRLLYAKSIEMTIDLGLT